MKQIKQGPGQLENNLKNKKQHLELKQYYLNYPPIQSHLDSIKT